MPSQSLKITLSGSGFAADYTARSYRLVPHHNGVDIELAGVAAGSLASAQRFAAKYGVTQAFASHREMVAAVRPTIDHVACVNHAHGAYVQEAAEAKVPVIVVEKPPVVWPGYAEGRTSDAATRKQESLAYLEGVLDTVRASGSRLLYAEDFVYVDGVKGLVEILGEAQRVGKGRVLYQRGICAHPGSHAPAYDTPHLSGGGALFNKACHPLGPCLYLKQVEGLLRNGRPIRPAKVCAVALQILKHQPPEAGEHFRVMQNVDDFGRITVVFEDQSVAEVLGYDLSISGIRNELSVTADFGQYDVRINPNDEIELFLPKADAAGDLLFREKLPTAAGVSFPRPNQFHAHGYVNEMEDAVLCALDAGRRPQSGPLLAWDTMVVLMASYQSHEQGSGFVDVRPDIERRAFLPSELPDPQQFGRVFQRK